MAIQNDVLRFHFSKPREVDMAEFLLPRVNIRLDLLPFGKHRGVNVVGLKDEHSPFMAPLVNHLSDRYQVLGDCQHMQDVPHYPFLADMAQRNFSNMFDGVRSVVPSFDDSRLLRLLEIGE